MPILIKHHNGIPYAQLDTHKVPEELDEAIQDLAEELGFDRTFGACALCPRATTESHTWGTVGVCPHEGRICDDNPAGFNTYAIHEEYLNILRLRDVVPAGIVISTKE